MEPKKNPKYDVHQKRGVLLNVGLVVSLILVITAFQWNTSITQEKIDLPFHDSFSDVLFVEEPRATVHKNEAPKPPRMQPTVALAPDIIEIKDLATALPPDIVVDQGNESNAVDLGTVDIPVETPEPDTFRTVETMPEPVGGWEAFYKTLKKNIKYPKRAERAQASGKVYVEFTVNNKGQLSNFKILKGIGHGCDEEATRVIALTKWNAGKQRGRPVNVRMVQPINFSFNY